MADGTPTRCDMIREAAQETYGDPGCTSPPCAVISLANNRKGYFQTKYAPAGLLSPSARAGRALALEDYRAAIAADVDTITGYYGDGAPTDVNWEHFPY